MLRTFGIIVLLLILIIYYVNKVQRSFTVSFKLNDVKLNNISLESLDAGQSFIRTRVEFLVSFIAAFKIVFSELYLEVYYKGVLVAKSADAIENFKSVTLSPNVNNLVYQTFDLKINSSLVDLIFKIKSKQDYTLDYKLSVKIFGIKINKNNSITSEQLKQI